MTDMPISRSRLLFGFGSGSSKNRFPLRFRDGSTRAGFALVAVIWSLGLISLLGVAVMVGARYRTRTTSSIASVAGAAAVAESAINLAIVEALDTGTGRNHKFLRRCRMPGGERVTLTIEDEAGKVDLNAATPAILIRLFTALTHDKSTGERIATRILNFRDPATDQANGNAGQPADSKSDDTRKGRFATILQLDQIEGISPQLFRAAIRFVTVRSGRPEPDADAASPALRKFLSLDQQAASPMPAPAASHDVTIRADVRTPGARFIREALVSLAVDNGEPFVIREWRRGNVVSRAIGSQAPDGDDMSDDSCLRVGKHRTL
jgi:general secretion pathway protein K